MPADLPRLGPYRLLAPLGAGGMGEVFLARLDREEGFRKLVAVKRMRPELAREAAFREQFAQEARLAASLNHPHVVQVLDYGRDGDEAYLAMELVEGLDLARCLAAGPPGGAHLELLCAVGLGCLRALAYAHAQQPPVVHGDLGPSNVLLGRQGEVKLADFGLARLQGLRPGPGGGAGKPAYLAPEVARGEPAGPAADLFGLGGVLLELACGAPPWPGPGLDAALAQARRGEVALAGRTPPLHSGLARVLQRALASRPSERYPGAEDMLEDLERLAAGLGVDTGPRVVAARVAALAPALEVEPGPPADGPPAVGRTRVAERGVGSRGSRRPGAWSRRPGAWLGLLGLVTAGGLAAWLTLRPQPPPPTARPLRTPGAGERISPNVKDSEDWPASSGARQAFASLARAAALAATDQARRTSRVHPPPSPSLPALPPRKEVLSGGANPVEPAPGPGVVLACAGLRGWSGEDGIAQAGPLPGRPFGPGVHGLRLQAEGLEVQLRLEVPPALDRPARLALRSAPDAVVRLDGRPRGMTPLGGLELPRGDHRLELAARGRPPLEVTLAVR